MKISSNYYPATIQSLPLLLPCCRATLLPDEVLALLAVLRLVLVLGLRPTLLLVHCVTLLTRHLIIIIIIIIIIVIIITYL